MDYKELAVKSAVGGLMTYGVVNYTSIIAKPGAAFDALLLGTKSVSLIAGVTVAAGILGGQLISDAVFDETTQEEANEKLSGYLTPAIAAAATLAASYFLFRGKISLSFCGKMAAVSAGSSMASDYVYDSFLEDLLE